MNWDKINKVNDVWVFNWFISRKYDLNSKLYIISRYQKVLKPITTLPLQSNGLLFPRQKRTIPTKQPHPWPNLTNRLDQKQTSLIVDHKALNVGGQVNPTASYWPGPVTRYFGPADLLLDHGLWHEFCPYLAYQLLSTTGPVYQEVVVFVGGDAGQTWGLVAVVDE